METAQGMFSLQDWSWYWGRRQNLLYVYFLFHHRDRELNEIIKREKCYYYKGTVYFPYLKARSKTAGLEFAAQVITTTGTADLQTWGQKKKVNICI